ncbi:hypothetical protein MTO96_003907 [Rhipicephalus appendiculatus]
MKDPPPGGPAWELGIGDLIIDLDADIEKSNDPMASSSAAASPPVEHQATVDKGLKMKIKRKNLAKHEIVECPGSPAKVVAASTSVERKDSGVLCTSVGTITEPDCLGPCEPGTSVTLEGIVWQETEGGVLVVNVTWRGKTYVGTLLDCTRHDWAPPRFSPVQGKLRNGKGRRFAVPCSPAKNEGRRRNKPPELELSPPDKKRARARSTPTPEAPCSPALILCPEPNCGKKYKHINGLRYHQSHAHGCGDAKGG